ncbi:hypothetical protein HELRODRAFT_186166 [Helobdella robusta]|uniref:Spermidine synthase n=1 Tax=Helobdella robusta TaxID=6412 RepID=T1FNR4_HELRO|nr:hypothetical protein HELRODRAFT_186166 [Helobdella robusta]ESN92017.1 hypothetical protein HELRODRAFT_186166 [Helobdella robusta]
MNAIRDGWFSEINPMWPGQCMSLKVQNVLHEEKSKFQDILIFDSQSHGRVLVLDGVIQLTEKDEFTYQEMMAFLPVNSHPDPKNVLVIGGGDGGIVRELVKHPKVESIVLCEIDDRVLDLCRQYLPSLSSALDHSKVKVHVGDGFEFMKGHKDAFDVIITDSSDPVGPAESLFKKEYYELIRSALKKDGVLCSQGECIWLHLDLIKNMIDFCKELFPSVSYACTPVPTYPSGQIGCLLCSLSQKTDFKEPVIKFTEEEMELMKLKCYTPAFHTACFSLPNFAKKVQS